MNILIYSKVGGCAEIIGNFYNVKNFMCTLSLFWTFHSKVCWSSVHGRKMVDITRQMERNAHLGISDFYLVEDKDGKLDFAGTMDLERVLEIVKEKVMEQKSCDVSTWINHYLNYLRPWSKCSRPLTFSRRLPTATLHFVLCHDNRHFGSL